MLMNYLNLWIKEIQELTRDKKALRQGILIPVILGAFYAVINPLIGELVNSRTEETLTIPVQGLEYADADFIETFARYDIVLQPYDGDMESAVRTAEEAAGIIFQPGYADQVTQEENARLVLLTNPTAGGMFGGGLSLSRIELAMSAYNRQLTVERLEAREVDLEVLHASSHRCGERRLVYRHRRHGRGKRAGYVRSAAGHASFRCTDIRGQVAGGLYGHGRAHRPHFARFLGGHECAARIDDKRRQRSAL